MEHGLMKTCYVSLLFPGLLHGSSGLSLPWRDSHDTVSLRDAISWSLGDHLVSR